MADLGKKAKKVKISSKDKVLYIYIYTMKGKFYTNQYILLEVSLSENEKKL